MIVHKAVLGERCPSHLKYNCTTALFVQLDAIIPREVKLGSSVTSYCTLTIPGAGLFGSRPINDDLTTIPFVVVTQQNTLKINIHLK